MTQATVSRDIRELQLVKTATADGRYRYVPGVGLRQGDAFAQPV